MASGGQIVKSQRFTPAPGAPAYLVDALRDIGIVEYVRQGGQKVSNPVVQRFVAKALHQDHWEGSTISNPWCAYYVNAKMEYQGITGTRQGMARSFLKWGNEVEEDDWKEGDIAVIWRGSYDDNVTGHVFFLLFWDDAYLYGLGGNQGDKVCIQAFRRDRLLGVRRPRSVWSSQTIRAGGGATGNEMVVKPAVDAMIPQAKAQAVVDAVEQTRGPLETLAQYKPWIMGVLTAITIGLALYALYCRYHDFKSGKNT